MKKNNTIDFLSLISVKSLKKYVATYLGEVVEKDHTSSAIEIIEDENIGKIYKIKYYYYNDYDPFPVYEVAFISSYGHLYEVDNRYFYLPIRLSDNEEFYKFMCKNLKKYNLVDEYNKQFEKAHKLALKQYINYKKQVEINSHKKKLENLDSKLQELENELTQLVKSK